MSRLYLYLASRSKSDTKLVAVLRGDSEVSSVVDVKSLKLPLITEQDIEKIVYDHRMQYELRIQSSPSYALLRKKLSKQGYKEIPLDPKSMVEFRDGAPVANTKGCHKIRTMLKKRKA
jgi:hypothetical protein